MDRACENCRFCIYAHPMRGEEEPYCERHGEWIGDTLLCSEWEAVIVSKPLTNAGTLRAMSDEELAKFESERMCCPPGKPGCEENNLTCNNCEQCWIGWLKAEAES